MLNGINTVSRELMCVYSSQETLQHCMYKLGVAGF